MVCTLIISPSGVKLGIVGGVELPDPHSLLEGSGKTHRHVVLRPYDRDNHLPQSWF